MKKFLSVLTVLLPLLMNNQQPAKADHTWYHDVVIDAANTYGVNANYLYYDIHGCEIGHTYELDLIGKNGEIGPFQFEETTYVWFAQESGIGGSVWNPVDQAYVAAWAHSVGYGGHWVCPM